MTTSARHEKELPGPAPDGAGCADLPGLTERQVEILKALTAYAAVVQTTPEGLLCSMGVELLRDLSALAQRVKLLEQANADANALIGAEADARTRDMRALGLGAPGRGK